MRRSRFIEEHMVVMLREAERTSVVEVARKHKVSDQTVCTWRQKFGSMDPADVKRLRALEAEDAKLKMRNPRRTSVGAGFRVDGGAGVYRITRRNPHGYLIWAPGL